MNILWKINIEIPIISEKLGNLSFVTGGWLDLTSRRLIKEHQLTVLFPSKDKIHFTDGNISVYSFEKNNSAVFRRILTNSRFDAIHVWGTEIPHTYYFLKECSRLNLLDKTYVSIQGLTSICSQHIYADLPFSVIIGNSFRDFLKHGNIYHTKRNFVKLGKFEIESLKIAKHILGRTDFDKAVAYEINPSANYHLCYETLRNPFYSGKVWNFDDCVKHSIFVSNSGSSHKGFHKMVEAFAIIKKQYPDAVLYTCGSNPFMTSPFKITTYSRYIKKIIKKNNLKDSIHFLGNLDEDEMLKMYLKANAFVCCSSIENSPNSLGEAMIVGTPVVSSYVGGIGTFIKHNENGFLYDFNAQYMLAYYIMQLFDNKKLVEAFKNNNVKIADEFFNREYNYKQLISIYQKKD